MRRLFHRAGLPIACVVAALALQSSHHLAAQTVQDGFKRFDNSIVPLPPAAESTLMATGAPIRQRKLLLEFAFEPRNFSELEGRIAKGEIVPDAEMREKYSGSRADSDRLASWLKDQGFEITQTSQDYLSLYARATVAQIEKSLGVEMRQVTYNGQTMPAAVTAPKLPVSVGEHVAAITGLQPFVRAVRHVIPRDKAQQKGKGGRIVPRPAAVRAPTYSLSDIRQAYDVAPVAATGTGETIAILIDTVPDRADLAAFWQQSGVPAGPPDRVQFINVQGANAPLPPREVEETLDTEWTSGVASGAHVRVYASGSLEFPYLNAALDRIAADAGTIAGLRVVSISLGLAEGYIPSGVVATERVIFAKLAARGVTAFVSSGDAGSNPDASGNAGGAKPRVEYQASDMWTIGVGGTTLNFDRATRRVQKETAWKGSGGGVSSIFPRPTWQPAYGGISSRNRLVPDVSAVADPVPGAFVWYDGAIYPVGGTSWSAPIWAGVYAVITEARLKQGRKRLGFLGPQLYALKANQGLRDITSGTNGAYKAGLGWDPVTGLGVPDAVLLLKSLP